MVEEDSDSEMKVSTATRALKTVELLEAILLDDGVDMKTLLLVQRVSTTWKNTIKGSIKLQEKLWFRPSMYQSQYDYLTNPLLFPRDEIETYYDLGDKKYQKFASFQKQSFICTALAFQDSCEIRFWKDDKTVYPKPGSWQDMLITKHMHTPLIIKVETYDAPRWLGVQFDYPVSSTMGSLMERVKKTRFLGS